MHHFSMTIVVLLSLTVRLPVQANQVSDLAPAIPKMVVAGGSQPWCTLTPVLLHFLLFFFFLFSFYLITVIR